MVINLCLDISIMLKGLHMIEGVDEKGEEFIDVKIKNNNGNIIKNKKVEKYGLSLNALVYIYAHNTIRIKGSYQGKEMVILIDSRSTHSFINEHVINVVKVTIIKTIVSTITVVNGNVTLCDAHIPGFKWFMQDYKFNASLRILKLVRCDVMLGVDWLRHYSPILFDFIKMKISFRKEGGMIELKGIVDGVSL